MSGVRGRKRWVRALTAGGLRVSVIGQFYANYGVRILDGNTVTFGDGVMLAPSVQIYSATHSVDAAERKAAWRRAYTVDIGDDVSRQPE